MGPKPSSLRAAALFVNRLDEVDGQAYWQEPAQRAGRWVACGDVRRQAQPAHDPGETAASLRPDWYRAARFAGHLDRAM